MDSDESYHSEGREYYYLYEMTNNSEKENIGAISKEENQQSVNVFTMANAQSYLLAQRAENIVKKAAYDFNVSKRFFRNKSENRDIEDMPADELNILICRFMIDIKGKMEMRSSQQLSLHFREVRHTINSLKARYIVLFSLS